MFRNILKYAGFSGKLLPVLSCSNIKMTNSLNPRGMTLFHTCDNVRRVSVFPFSERNASVYSEIRFSRKMVENALDSLRHLQRTGDIGAYLLETAEQIFYNIYLHPDTLSLSDYSNQILHANRLLMKRILREPDFDCCYINLEQIAAKLLIHDLRDRNNPVSMLLLEPEWQKLLYTGLSGVEHCWKTETEGGSFLFWGIDGHRKRYSLRLKQENGRSMLYSGDDSAHPDIFFLEKTSLTDALESGRLMPGLFLDFLKIYFLRDFRVFGGYFQKAYLHHMANGLANVLSHDSSLLSYADNIRKKRSEYLTGMEIFLYRDGQTAYRAGSAEMLEKDDFNSGIFDSLLDISVYQAHINSLITVQTKIKPRT